MSKLDEKVALYTEAAEKLDLGLSEDLIAKVAAALGPSLYNKDAETVSCTDESELETVKKNFLEKKLGISDHTLFDTALKSVCEKMGKSNPKKYRTLFYALLAKEFGKEDLYA
jgi:hypothetical protein